MALAAGIMPCTHVLGEVRFIFKEKILEKRNHAARLHQEKIARASASKAAADAVHSSGKGAKTQESSEAPIVSASAADWNQKL